MLLSCLREVKRFKMKYLKVKPDVHRAMAIEAVSNDIDLEDLTTAVLERCLENGTVVDVVKEEFTEDSDTDEDGSD